MLFAANADGPHDNILGLVEVGGFPLVTVSEIIGTIKVPDQGRIKEFTCSQHAVVLPMAKCDFIDFINLHKTGATSSTFFIERIPPMHNPVAAMHGPVARRFFKQMVAGTRHLHELGIAHLDLKLENSLMGSLGIDATLMISDFGMSKKVGVAGRCDTRIAKGTESYAPPEVSFPNHFALTADSNAFAVDVWTLGVCLLMLVGGFGEIFNQKFLKKPKHAVFAAMRDAQKSGANGLREWCSATTYRGTALWRFDNFLPDSLKSLLDSMLRVDPETRPTLAQVADDPWFKGITEPTPQVDAPLPRSLAPAVGAPQHRSLAATAPAAALSAPAAPAFRGLSAAADDEAEEPRYNACSAAPPAAPSAAYRGLSADDDEAQPPPIGRCIARTLV
jgi:serine/threonine protein kinase